MDCSWCDTQHLSTFLLLDTTNIEYHHQTTGGKHATTMLIIMVHQANHKIADFNFKRLVFGQHLTVVLYVSFCSLSLMIQEKVEDIADHYLVV
jgi:hypothetical protein